MTETVKLERRGPVLEITLDRPKANAIDVATSLALHAAFKQLDEDPGLRVAILTGAGERFFSAGWDLKAAAEGREHVESDHGPGGFAGLTEYHGLDKPVIAAINGYAVAGGFELALAADLIVAAEHAECWLSEVTLGIVPDAGGLLRLPKRMPRNIAAELLLTGRRMSAAEGADWGLFNTVVPQAELMATARALADSLAENAPLALAAAKEVLRETESLTVAEGYAALRSGRLEAYGRMLASEDKEEGPRAFAEKRKPVWKGR